MPLFNKINKMENDFKVGQKVWLDNRSIVEIVETLKDSIFTYVKIEGLEVWPVMTYRLSEIK